jgi:hypothetical protein
MHRGGQFITSLISAAVGASPTRAAKKAAARSLFLTPAQVATLRSALHDDSQDYFYSACISIVDALRGLQCGFYSWATVKLYYSAFYSLRSLLAADRVCVFYVDSSPFSVLANAGECGTAGSGQTHAYVLERFATQNPNHRFVKQDVDAVPALDWIIEKREDANYKIPRFSEPNAPAHFGQIELYGVRKLVSTYLADTADIYTFDKDHAMLAIPIAALVEAASVAKGLGTVRFAVDELSMLTSECCDDTGPLAPMTNVFRAFVS